jgi:hypothetical protein
MSAPRALVSVALLVGLTACLDVDNPKPQDSQIRVINAANSAINISVDGNATLEGVSPSSISALFLAAGTHQLTMQTSTGLSTTLTVNTASQEVTTTYAYSPSPNAIGVVVLDTGGIVPSGKAKLRVTHLSKLAGNVEIWRTQPDFKTPTRLQTPFPYLATSAFVQSDSGAWEVFVTPVGSNEKLATTRLFRIPSTGKRTVVLLDSSGVMIFRVLPE